MSYLTQKLILRALAIFLFLAFLSAGYYLFVFKEGSSLRGDNVLRSDLDGKRSDLASQEPRIYPEPIEAPPLPAYQGVPIGVINEDKIVSAIYPEATKTKLKNELLALAKSVSQNPDNLDNWLRAGVIKKFFGDYLGARDAWEYASLIRPQNSTSFANLGGLYAFYLKDFSKAEFSYKKAIENSPGDIYLYTSLADLYQSMESSLRGGAPTKQSVSHSELGEESQVVTIIQSGLVSNHNNQTLLSYLGRFYKEQGNFPKALEYYQKVLKLDPKNQAIIAEIEFLNKQH